MPSSAPSVSDQPRGTPLWFLLLTVVPLLFVLAGMGYAAVQRSTVSDHLARAAHAGMAHWPAGLPVQVSTDTDCQTGPTGACVLLGTTAGAVRWWPEEDWSRAWLPFDQWRTAHASAMNAARSPYGRALIQLGEKGTQPFLGPVLAMAVRNSGQPSWRIGLLIPAKADRSFNGEPPMLSDSSAGPVALFSDGMVLPIRHDDGQTFILAQGPADQAPRMVAALQRAPDPGALPTAPTPSQASLPATVLLPATFSTAPLILGKRATAGPLVTPTTVAP